MYPSKSGRLTEFPWKLKWEKTAFLIKITNLHEGGCYVKIWDNKMVTDCWYYLLLFMSEVFLLFNKFGK